MHLYREAQEWLSARGTDQWQPVDGRSEDLWQRVRTNIACSIEQGDCYLALWDGVPVGTITVDEYADPEFWRDEDDPRSALYVHRMIVARDMAGRGLGAELLRWAERKAAARGRRWLRADAWSTNTALHDYYKGQNFSHVRTVILPHRGSGALFQRRVPKRRNPSST
jgi:GNAT superfamily N-acetyltransferase